MMPSDHNMTEADRGCGQRLRTAREAAGLSVSQVAERLKMPVRIVESLEAEDWSRLGAPVFIRGQLRSYARLLGLPTESVHVASGVAPIEPARLAPRTYTPPMRRFAEQAARRMVYVVITAAIAVPVWLATRSHLTLPEPASASLDLPATSQPGNEHRPRQAADKPRPTPLVASLTPVPQRAESPELSLRLNADSWVEVVAPDGSTVEEALLRQGDQRSYTAGQVGRIVLGNASAVEVSHRGVVQDLSPYLRANVARFTVSSDGSLAPAAQ
jgi:cytoskeleton protein RodZ